MRASPALLGSWCCLAAMPLACGLDRSGSQPVVDPLPPTGGSGGSGAGGTGAGATGAGGQLTFSDPVTLCCQQ